MDLTALAKQFVNIAEPEVASSNVPAAVKAHLDEFAMQGAYGYFLVVGATWECQLALK